MTADGLVWVFDLGELGALIDAGKMHEAVGQGLDIRWGENTVPGRIKSMTEENGRVKVTVEIDAPPGWLDLGISGVPVPEAGSGVVGEAAPGQGGDDV